MDLLKRAEQTEFLSVTDMLKATIAEESGRRYVYIESSNHTLDHQGEIVLAKALRESADYYLKFGNLDLDHITQIGARAGIRNYSLFEVGRPVDVRFDGDSTMVKGEIYKGDGQTAELANQFWESMTLLSPPQRWYPSVGGSVLEKVSGIHPDTKSSCQFVRRVRWTNIGFSKTPANPGVAQVSTVPFGALAKSWTTQGFDLAKALSAGHAVNPVDMTGGAALRTQSLHGSPASYWDFRERMAGDLLKDRVRNPTAERMIEFAQHQYGLTADDASNWVVRLLRDTKQSLNQRKTRR